MLSIFIIYSVAISCILLFVFMMFSRLFGPALRCDARYDVMT